MIDELKLLQPTPVPPVDKAKRLPVGSDTYNEIVTFLFDEAEMLDDLRFNDWLATLAKDLEYNVPIRHTRPSRELNKTIIRTVQHMHDDYGSIQLRLLRLTDTKSAWGEDPPSRCRRLVSNIRAYGTSDTKSFRVDSYLLLTRSRFDSDAFDLIPCKRNDVLRREKDGWKLARREIILDQAVLGTPNLAIFL
jgi:3-phenylpropionate/cinnamic acid dioxygenase small subunit